MKTKICKLCLKELDIGSFRKYHNTCKDCLAISGRVRSQKYYQENKDKLKIERKKYFVDYYSKNKKKIAEKAHKYQLKLKEEIFENYGGAKCVCCGEKNIEFLSLDHTNGGGNKDRKLLTGSDRNGGYHFYYFLKKAGFPNKDKYQVLCMNCQFGTLNGRICPHKR